MSGPRVLVANAVTMNGGDAAILRALLRHLDAALGPDVDVRVADDHPADAALRHPDLTIVAPLQKALLRYPRTRFVGRLVRDANRARWVLAAHLHRRARPLARALLRAHEWRKLEDYAALDLAVSTGGTYLVERYSPWPRLTELRVLQALGVPVVLYTQSLGPFRRPDLVRGVRRVVTGAASVLLRDERSLEHLRRIGAAGPACEVLADSVFTFAGRDGWSAPPDVPHDVVVSVRPWAHFEQPDAQSRYRAAVARLTTELVHRGSTVTFLSTCQGSPNYLDDSAEATEIVAGLPADVRDAVVVDRDAHDVRDLLRRVGAADLVVSTRMHMAILSLCAGTPVVPIAYEFKTRELFDALGLGEHVLDIDHLEEAALVEATDRFWAQRDQWSAGLPAAVAAQRSSADGAIARLAAATRAAPSR